MKANWILGASALTLLFAQSASAKPAEIPIDPPAPAGKCVTDEGPCGMLGACPVTSICYGERCLALGDTDCTSQAECGGPLCVAMDGTCGAGCAEGYTCESGYCLQSLNPTVESSDAGAEASCDGGACEDPGTQVGLDAGAASDCEGVECESGEPVATTDAPDAEPTGAAPAAGDEEASDTESDTDTESKASSSSVCSAAPGLAGGSRVGLFALISLAGLVSRRRRP